MLKWFKPLFKAEKRPTPQADVLAFEKRIETEVQELELEELKTLCYRCLMRIMPFIAGKGQGLDNFQGRERQRQLLYILRLVDQATKISTSTVNDLPGFWNAEWKEKIASLRYAVQLFQFGGIGFFRNPYLNDRLAAYSDLYRIDPILAIIFESLFKLDFGLENDKSSIPPIWQFALGLFKIVCAIKINDQAEIATGLIMNRQRSGIMERVVAMLTARSSDEVDVDFLIKAKKETEQAARAIARDTISYAADKVATFYSAGEMIREAIINDLDAIKGKRTFVPADTAQYGSSWDNFQKMLLDMDCAYWAQLYTDYFANNFETKPEALDRRLRLPGNIIPKGAAAIGHYLAELDKGAELLNEARIIILGDKGAGKTCIARRLVDPESEMTTPEESTAGVETLNWKVKGNKGMINVSIWDFAGHTVTHAAHQFFLSERCLYILVYNGRTQGDLRYWLDHVNNYGGNSRVVVLVNLFDRNNVKLHENNLKERYKDKILGFYYFSVKEDQQELRQFRKEVSSIIRDNPFWNKQAIPSTYTAVKSDLEVTFLDPGVDQFIGYISREDFNTIALKHQVNRKNLAQLLENFHALGICLWYKNISGLDSFVLNPDWLSHGVYTIINWLSSQNRYGIAKHELKLVFKDKPDRYPEGKCYDFLFELLKHYELAYEVRDGEQLLIPHLMDQDRPADLPAFETEESLQVNYQAVQPLPPDTISRFIVKHHHQIRNQEEVWRYGLILEDGRGSLAMVREQDWMISLIVKGAFKSDFIAELRYSLNNIFASYKNQHPTLEYRIDVLGANDADWKGDHQELFLPEQKVLNHLNHLRPYYDDRTNRSIPLGYVARDYKLQAPYKWHVFISHASDDKEDVAVPLARALQAYGIEVWLDTDQLLPGDKLLDGLNKGVSESRYGIIIFSKQFFQKEWPRDELAAFLSREKQKKTTNIIPILHGVAISDIVIEQPLLADRVALSMEMGLDEVVGGVLRVLGRGGSGLWKV